ncbi:type IV pilin protein [Candidatus Avelusimicrobium luingense]|uniref:type IV pilin protein n=1 Tax=Candidatus Avelusimicrobium luingense TaxID=3416211 RepID=UPI003D13E59A
MTHKISGRLGGFTLIELLVVVLIIGILASVALPQYKQAVNKAKMTQAMAVLESMGKAEEAYYLANGEYTTDMDALDMGVGASVFSPNWTAIILDTNGTAPHLETRAKFLPNYVYLIYQLNKGKMYCSLTGTAKTQQVCKKMYGDTEVMVDPSNSSYDMYLISR